ncbi:KamA family radical SAM protein [Abyssogena phaseoliformis symbiont]|nr:KamA family radical SAM protein [Abyssogena phaseoliformis symbiont]MBW5289534.1 Lysyl-lysine 2,3-aminomutase [Candidatus Ruthia sp. Apha_13_S6]
MMENNWQYHARYALKGANQSNDFFKTKAFKDQTFPIKIPLEFAQLIDKSNKNDPLLKQVISAKVLSKSASFSLSPLEDEKHSPVVGLIHKYPNRVLLITSQVCAIHCQYCFRQNFNYAEHDAISNWVEVQNYIVNNTKINEVILSGGDPLSLSDDKLSVLIDNIANIAHIRTLRIHTRSAVVTPSRITNKLVDMFNHSRLNVVLVLHTNHVQELSAQFTQKITKLSGVTLLNQSVLLKGVNDSIEVLTELCLKLFDLGILPYYLHMLDKVQGTQDFLVKDDYAIQLHQQLKNNLSGYLVPKLVRDNGNHSKDWLL